MIINHMQKGVVDRAGLRYSSPIKALSMANHQILTLEVSRVAKVLANPSGPARDCNLSTGPTHRMEVRHDG